MTIALAKRTHVWAGNPSYDVGKYHYATSSEQDPACVVEPGTPEDVGKIVRFPPIGAVRCLLSLPLSCATLPDTQLNVIAAEKVPFAVRDR